MPSRSLRHRIHEIIFEADTPAGKYFDVILLGLICLSILVVMLESSADFNQTYGTLFFYIEWFLTIVFTIEYILRLWVTINPVRYALSFYGIVDILAILPSYLALFLANAQYFLIIRILRLMRVFRIFKLGQYLTEGDQLMRAVLASRNKISVFLFVVTILVIIIGSFMYLIEGGSNPGFSSIPRAVYWAIVTITTVGYGDITPQTRVGQFVSAVVMILGYAIIAVPTGIVTNEIIRTTKKVSTQVCRYCAREGHADDAIYCKYCGGRLNPAGGGRLPREIKGQ
ncbi:voltage-gated potassium channel [Lewinella marina]|uniref:Ion transporter n=1 Tax=Neolewinella marina TaxID=438751 RepID=A0A2G0CGF9_9BACT|nr:ion transporter [Neolewinella marina]NJB86492.1 voltage-gated potassium channel [Neolewinella marina]PHK99048.1 ion transporter [Neolewinella marina]